MSNFVEDLPNTIHVVWFQLAQYSCGTVALMVLGQFPDSCGPRTIRATVP
jgi:hypothetical protein